MSVYIVAHRQFDSPFMREPGYHVIVAGAARTGHDFGDCFDDAGKADEGDGGRKVDDSDEGRSTDQAKNVGRTVAFPDNISDKNQTFCELTALYWLWRHCEDDYIGLVHYRRYFSNRWSDRQILSEKDIRRALHRYDIILPQVAFQKVTMREEFTRQCGTLQDLEQLRTIIARQCPDYLPAFDQYFAGKRTCFMNMMICPRTLLDQYCAWLFPILFAMERETSLSGRSAYQQRLYGFLGERLLNIWVARNKLRACHVFLLETQKQLSPAMDLVYRLARTSTWWLQMGKPGTVRE